MRTIPYIAENNRLWSLCTGIASPCFWAAANDREQFEGLLVLCLSSPRSEWIDDAGMISQSTAVHNTVTAESGARQGRLLAFRKAAVTQ